MCKRCPFCYVEFYATADGRLTWNGPEGTADDWKQIEDSMTSGDDPLFGGNTDKKYQALHKQIMEADQTYDVAI